MTVWWFVIFVLLVLIELITVNLVTIWFAIGASFAILISIFSDSLIIQLIGFIIVSVISLIISKPVINRFRVDKLTPTNLDRVLGMSADVIKDISPDKSGQIKVLGSVWTAIADRSFKVGDKVRVKKIVGVKLFVEEEI